MEGLEKRIRKSSLGDYVAEWGIAHEESIPNPNGIGFIMPGFFVYRSSHYDTLEEAEKAIYE